MIRIEIQADTVAEARAEMMALIGGTAYPEAGAYCYGREEQVELDAVARRAAEPKASASEAVEEPAPKPAAEPQADDTVGQLPDATPEDEPFPPTQKTQDFADENNVPLDQVTGSGKNGRITKHDVEAWLRDNEPAPDTGARRDNEPEPEPEAKPEPKAEAKPAPKAEGEVSLDDVRTGLKKLNDVMGLEACMTLLKEFDATNIKQLADGQRAPFLGRVTETLELHDDE